MRKVFKRNGIEIKVMILDVDNERVKVQIKKQGIGVISFDAGEPDNI